MAYSTSIANQSSFHDRSDLASRGPERPFVRCSGISIGAFSTASVDIDSDLDLELGELVEMVCDIESGRSRLVKQYTGETAVDAVRTRQSERVLALSDGKDVAAG